MKKKKKNCWVCVLETLLLFISYEAIALNIYNTLMLYNES